MKVESRAPLRVDFAGTWSNLPWFAGTEGGVVVCAAIELSVHVEFLLGDRRIRLHSEGTNEHVTLESSGHLVYDGRLDRYKAALNMLPVTGGIEILARSDAPQGADLGEPESMDTALLAGLAACRQEAYEPAELADLGVMLESYELGETPWQQGHYAAVLGGFLDLEFGSQGVTVRRLSVPAEAAQELSEHSVVAYAGRSHFSSQGHSRVQASYDSDDARIREALCTMRDIGRQTGAVIEAADWKKLADLMDESWSNQRLLDETISTPAMVRIEEAMRSAGAWGLRSTGRGAGGCLLALCSPRSRSQVASAAVSAGGELIEASFGYEGVAVRSHDDATQ